MNILFLVVLATFHPATTQTNGATTFTSEPYYTYEVKPARLLKEACRLLETEKQSAVFKATTYSESMFAEPDTLETRQVFVECAEGRNK